MDGWASFFFFVFKSYLQWCSLYVITQVDAVYPLEKVPNYRTTSEKEMRKDT